MIAACSSWLPVGTTQGLPLRVVRLRDGAPGLIAQGDDQVFVVTTTIGSLVEAAENDPVVLRFIHDLFPDQEAVVTVTLVCLVLASVILSGVAYSAAARAERASRTAREHLLRIAEDVRDLSDDRFPVEVTYRSIGVDEPPTRRELDRRLSELEEKRALPVLPVRKLCVNCAHSFEDNKGRGLACKARLQRHNGAWSWCGKINPKHDCKLWTMRAKEPA